MNTTTAPAALISEGGQTLLGGLNRVFHCNHYNAHLQMTVLLTKGLTKGLSTLNPEKLLIDAATPLIDILKNQGYTTEQLIDEFSLCGFGILQQSGEKIWETPSSHYGESIYSHGKGHKSCYFNSGYIQGIVNHKVTETECQVTGAHADKYEVADESISLANYLTKEFALTTDIPARFDFPECQTFQTQVDEDKILSVVKTLPLCGKKTEGATGLIDAFGVVLTNHFADYYNYISYETYNSLCKVGIPEEDNKEMFIQSGHVCAFNTFGGIMSSPEWYDLIEPTCKTREDWFHGMVAVINALGWGVYRIEKIVPEKEFIVRVYNSYEGVGYRRMYPPAKDKNLSFLAMGAALGLVHLLWKVDIRTRPTLTQKFFVEQFNNSNNSYSAEQTHAIATGDAYDRFIIYK